MMWSMNQDAVARNTELHERLLKEIPVQHERWQLSPSELRSVEDRYAKFTKPKSIQRPKDALLLWKLICVNSGADVSSRVTSQGHEVGGSEGGSGVTAEGELPAFAGYLKRHADMTNWKPGDWEDLAQKMEVENLTAVVHFLFYGLGLPKPVVSQVAAFLRWNLEISEAGYLATLKPCLDEKTWRDMADEAMNEDGQEGLVIGMEPSESALLLYRHHFASPYDEYKEIDLEAFTDNVELLRDTYFANVSTALRHEIFTHLLNDRFTKLHHSAWRAGQNPDDETLPYTWRYKPHSDRDKRVYRAYMDGDYEFFDNIHKRPRLDSDDEDDEDYAGPSWISRIKKKARKNDKKNEKKKRPPYVLRQYSEAQSLRIGGYSGVAWDARLLNNNNIRSLRIPKVEASHYEDLVAHPAFCALLEHFHAGDSDSGHGSRIEPELLKSFIGLCPNLSHIDLESHCNADNSVVQAILDSSPNIVYIGISGHDKSRGKVQPLALKPLLDPPSLSRWPNLIELHFLDQTMHEIWFLEKVAAVRPKIVIVTGDTVGNGIAAQMVAFESGGEWHDRIAGDEAPDEVVTEADEEALAVYHEQLMDMMGPSMFW